MSSRTKRDKTTASDAAAVMPATLPQVPNFSVPHLLHNGPISVGLDIGFGVTKIVTAVDGQYVQTSFPSVAAHAHDIRYNADKTSAKYPGEQITTDEGEFFVGNYALSQGKAAELLRLDGRTANNDARGMAFRKLMMQVAFAKIFPYTDDQVIYVVIATGLPVAHMKDAPLLKESLMGVYKIRANNASIIVHVTDVMVMPQPYGSLYSQQILLDGTINPLHTADIVGIVDVGFYTIDLTLDDDTEYIDSKSDSVEGGIHVAHNRLSMSMNALYRILLPPDVLDEALQTNKVKISGEPRPHKDEVESALQPIIDMTLMMMNRLWEGGQLIDVIYVVGGGAEVVIAAIKKAYPNARLLSDPQMSNARGYLHYANFIRRQAA